MRSEFEAWAKSVMVPNLERYAYGDYKSPHIEIAWQAWQAATKAASEVCMEWRAGCDNRSMQAEGWAAAECAQAIMARMDVPNAELTRAEGVALNEMLGSAGRRTTGD